MQRQKRRSTPSTRFHNMMAGPIKPALRMASVFIGLFVAMVNPSRSMAQFVTPQNSLQGDQYGQLRQGGFLRSNNGRYSLVFEGGGDIVLYDNGQVLSVYGFWYNPATGRVVYDYTPFSTPVLWNTNTHSTVYDSSQFSGSRADVFVLQPDANLVMYGSLFSFGRQEASNVPFWNVGISRPYYAATGGNPILVLQDDGNLVIYVYNGIPIWSYRTGLL